MVRTERRISEFIMENGKRNNDPWVPLPEETASIGQAPENPHHQMIESERYIQSLERKLAKLTKTRKKEPTSRDIISSLALFHDDQMRRYVADTAITDVGLATTSSSDEPVTQSSFVQRKLHPERQPLSAEEVAELVKEDVMAKVFEETVDSEEGNSKVTKSLSSSGQVTQNSAARLASPKCLTADRTGAAADVNLQVTPSENVDSSDSPRDGAIDVPVEENWANFEEMQEQTPEDTAENS